jgi:hypothetical protein
VHAFPLLTIACVVVAALDSQLKEQSYHYLTAVQKGLLGRELKKEVKVERGRGQQRYLAKRFSVLLITKTCFYRRKHLLSFICSVFYV